MSYAHNDHYKWIETNESVKCSELGKEVANILGFVGEGSISERLPTLETMIKKQNEYYGRFVCKTPNIMELPKEVTEE